MSAHSRPALLATALALLFCAQGLVAQQGPPQGPPPGPPGGDNGQPRMGGGRHGGEPPTGDDHGPMHGGGGPPPGGEGRGTGSTMRGGLQLAPPGRWWSDAAFAASLHLQPEQQSRMSKVFADNRDTLFARYDELKRREQELEALTRSTPLSEQALFAGIDRVAGARAELEKADAHMQLQLRMQLTADQLKTLDEHRPSPPPH